MTTKGDDRPGCLAHHTSVVFGDKMYLFGGSNLETENKKFYALDLNTLKWEVVKVKAASEAALSRDEHTALVYENEGSMIVFAGFVQGQRTNDIVKYFFQDAKWAKVPLKAGSLVPKPRSSHSAVIHQGGMWIFGGRDDDNNKLNDLWRYDIAANTWQEIKPADGVYPLERSGHSCDVYDGQYLIVFGGIYEITKELNDLHVFDLNKRLWVTLFEEQNSPIKGARDGSPSFTHHADIAAATDLTHSSLLNQSPAIGKKSTMGPVAIQSPPAKKQQGSPSKAGFHSSTARKVGGLQLNMTASSRNAAKNGLNTFTGP